MGAQELNTGHTVHLMYEIYTQHYQKSAVAMYIHMSLWSKLGPVEQNSIYFISSVNA
jgi:hypothetical protein